MMTSRPPRLDRQGTALFLDLDGTLAEIRPRPDDVGPERRRTAVLTALAEAMGGRVAVLTGRTLAEADHITGGAVPAIGAVHGLVRRRPAGDVDEPRAAPGLPQARDSLRRLADDLGLLIEDKGSSVAIHYRARPETGAEVRAAARRVAEATELILQEGTMVCELRSPGPHKGDALRAFLAEPPFAGHVPVMVGDDLTDEHAFAAADAAGGYGILVGPPRETRARFRLGSVAEVLDWLDDDGEDA